MPKKEKPKADKNIDSPAEEVTENLETEESDDAVAPAKVDDVFAKPFPEVKEPVAESEKEAPVKVEPVLRENKNPKELKRKERKVRLAVFALGVLLGVIISAIIFGFLYYKSGRDLYSSYNSIITSQKKLTGLIVAQKDKPKIGQINSSCVTLSEAEKGTINSWKSYENNRYGLTFKLPVSFKEDKPSTTSQFFLSEQTDKTSYLTVMTGEAVKNSIPTGYSPESEKKAQVACQEATISYYDDKTGEQRINLVQLTVNDVPYRFEYNYGSSEEALTNNDFAKMFDLFLKTINIQQ